MSHDEYYCDPICSGPVFLSLSARYRSQLQKMTEETDVPVGDSLRLSEFVAWLVEHHLLRACACAQETTDFKKRQEVMSNVISELYILCCRCFIVQLVHAAYNRFRASVGDWQCASVIGVVKQMHEDVSDYSGDYQTARDPVTVFRVSLGIIEPYWQQYAKLPSDLQSSQQRMRPQRIHRAASMADEHLASMMFVNLRNEDEAARGEAAGLFHAQADADGNINVPKVERTMSGSRIVSAPTPRVQKLFFADLGDAPETLKGANEVNENSRNYRLAYTMMLGLETVVRINAHSRLRIFQQSVLGLSSFVDACKDYLEEIDFGFLNEAMSEIKEYRGRNLSDDVLQRVLSAVSYRYTLPSVGSQFSPEHVLGDDEQLWFVDLAPALFARVRQLCKIDDVVYLSSLAQKRFSFIEFNSNSKSGEVFFFSHDGRFILKTISDKEASVLLTMLPEYLHRIQAGDSLLMRICGLYHMHTVNDSRPVFFIVAISVFDDRGLGLHHQFDLKGSSAGRLARDDEAVKKDNNWTKDKMRVNLPADLKRSVAAALEADAHFLARHRVLDYSVLIGIHDRHSLVRGRHNKGVRLLQSVLKESLSPPTETSTQAQRLSVGPSSPGEGRAPPPPAPTPNPSVTRVMRRDSSSCKIPAARQVQGHQKDGDHTLHALDCAQETEPGQSCGHDLARAPPTEARFLSGKLELGDKVRTWRATGAEEEEHEEEEEADAGQEAKAKAAGERGTVRLLSQLPTYQLPHGTLGSRSLSSASCEPSGAAISGGGEQKEVSKATHRCDICAERFVLRADLASHAALCQGLHRLFRQYDREGSKGLGSRSVDVITRSVARSTVAGEAFGSGAVEERPVQAAGDLSQGTDEADWSLSLELVEVEEDDQPEGLVINAEAEPRACPQGEGGLETLERMRQGERDIKQDPADLGAQEVAVGQQQRSCDLLAEEHQQSTCALTWSSGSRMLPSPIHDAAKHVQSLLPNADAVADKKISLGSEVSVTEDRDRFFVSHGGNSNHARECLMSQSDTLHHIASEKANPSTQFKQPDFESELQPQARHATVNRPSASGAAQQRRVAALRPEEQVLGRETSSSSLDELASDVEKDSESPKPWRGIHGPIQAEGVNGLNGQFVYFIGIIDFLIPWSAKKKGEFVLNCMRGRRLTGSCMPPKAYAKRQTKFVTLNVLRLFNTRNAIKYACNFSARPHELELFNIEGAAGGKYRHRLRRDDVNTMTSRRALPSPIGGPKSSKGKDKHKEGSTSNAEPDASSQGKESTRRGSFRLVRDTLTFERSNNNPLPEHNDNPMSGQKKDKSLTGRGGAVVRPTALGVPTLARAVLQKSNTE